MMILFYIAAAVTVVSTFIAIQSCNAIHALLYLVVSLLSTALIFFIYGAAFAAALEVIIYAGAIMVLFIFVIMMLNRGREAVYQECEWLQPRTWIGPSILSGILLLELIYLLSLSPSEEKTLTPIGAAEVGAALYGPYLLGVELAGILLLAGLVGAYHLGRREEEEKGY